MKSLLLLVVVTVSTAAEFSVEEKSTIVSLHNKIRQNVEPPATTMPDLEWSDELAIAAQLYASQCSSINPMFRDEELQGIDSEGFGANVAIGEGPSYSIPGLISQWEGQKSHYNYYCNTCDFGKCKRIKQLLTAETTRVGCAIQDCMSSSENTIQLHPMVFICLYNERFSAASRPYQSPVDTCTKCPEDPECSRVTRPPVIKPPNPEYDGEVNYIERCPPICTKEYCTAHDRKKFFSKACSMPDKSGRTCVLTNCKLCYFDRRYRILPPGCNDKICRDWRNRKCLREWTQCIKDNFQKPAYPGNQHLHTMKYFKCHIPPK